MTQLRHCGMKAAPTRCKQMSGAVFQSKFIYGHKSQFHVVFAVTKYSSSFEFFQQLKNAKTNLSLQTMTCGLQSASF